MKLRAAALAWMLAILAGMSIPASSLPTSALFTADKLLHFGCFFTLTILWQRALTGSWKKRAVLALVIGVAFGAATEVYQGLMPIGRTADVFDLLADTAGCLVGLALYGFFFRQKEKRLSNPAPFTVS